MLASPLAASDNENPSCPAAKCHDSMQGLSDLDLKDDAIAVDKRTPGVQELSTERDETTQANYARCLSERPESDAHVALIDSLRCEMQHNVQLREQAAVMKNEKEDLELEKRDLSRDIERRRVENESLVQMSTSHTQIINKFIARTTFLEDRIGLCEKEAAEATEASEVLRRDLQSKTQECAELYDAIYELESVTAQAQKSVVEQPTAHSVLCTERSFEALWCKNCEDVERYKADNISLGHMSTGLQASQQAHSVLVSSLLQRIAFLESKVAAVEQQAEDAKNATEMQRSELEKTMQVIDD